jgi:hypothetical protein
LALHELEPLLLVRYGSDSLTCRLDTGAGKTVFYEPFFRRYRTAIETLHTLDTVMFGGVGGVRQIPAYRIPEIQIVVGDTTVVLAEVEVYTQALWAGDQNFLHCNVGTDLLYQFDEYITNFRTMSVLLR